MHKYVSRILAVILVIALAVPAAAAAPNAQNIRSVYVESLDISAVIPDQYDGMTPTMKDNDPVFVQRQIQVPKFKTWCEENDIHLWVLSKDGTSNFTISTYVLDEAESFMECDPEYIENTVEYMAEAHEEKGKDVKKAEVFEQGHVPFVRVDYVDTDKSNNIDMFTVLDVMTEDEEIQHVQYFVNFTTSKAMDAKTEKMVEDFVKGLNMGVYCDSDSGVYFEANAEWYHMTENEKDGTKAWLVCSKQPLSAISYSTTDLYEKAGGEEAGVDREEVNNDAFTEADVAEMIGVKTEVKKVTYNDLEFFVAEYQEQGANMTFAIRFDYGFMNMFMNVETQKGSNAKNFETLLETVIVPE